MRALVAKIAVQMSKVGITGNHRCVQLLPRPKREAVPPIGMKVAAHLVRRVGVQRALILGAASGLGAANEIDHMPRRFLGHLGSKHDVAQELAARRRSDLIGADDTSGSVARAFAEQTLDEPLNRRRFLSLPRPT